jgi:hypothetical protein
LVFFFCLPGSHNDINVLQWSPLFVKLCEGEATEVNFLINGHDYKMGYYITYDIYPSWVTFVKTIGQQQGIRKSILLSHRKWYARMSNEPSEFYKLISQ